MTWLDLASNAIWVPITLLALGLIWWDIRAPHRRFVIALALALSLSSVAIFAAEVNYEWCESVCPYVGPITWYVIGCFAC